MEGITNPPWVYGPKEVGEWIDATYRGKEEKIKKKENIERKNVEIRLSGGERKISKKWIGIFRYCEEDIEEVLGIVLKALYKTGFKRLLYANIKIEKQGKVSLKDLENISVGIDKKKIKLYLFSTPSSKISVEKFWCAIGSTYPHYNEVDHPLIRYKIRASTMYRITVLYTILCDKENPPVFKDISTEKFSCVEIKNGNYTDYVASGKDISSSDFETDGLYTFFRTKDGKIKSLLIRNGTYLKWKGSKIVESTEKVSHLSLSFDGESIKGHIKTDNPVKITIRYDFSPSTATYKPVPDEWVWAWTEKLKKKYYSRSLKFKKDGGKIIIDCPSGRGEFMLEKKAG